MKTAYQATYKVRKGDTLQLIGKVLQVNWQFIYYLNKFTIGPNPKILQISQQLHIPTQTSIEAWNTIMNTDLVRGLTLDWHHQQRSLERLLQDSANAYTEEQLKESCEKLKLDINIAKLLWKMRIKHSMNPWREIVQILCKLLHAGLPNEVYTVEQE